MVRPDTPRKAEGFVFLKAFRCGTFMKMCIRNLLDDTRVINQMVKKEKGESRGRKGGERRHLVFSLCPDLGSCHLLGLFSYNINTITQSQFAGMQDNRSYII